MGHILLVNADGPETRVALVENGQLIELHIERPADRRIVGNIYQGRVVRVLPGMQAAFVDIGLERAAFLYAGDVPPLGEEGEPTPEAADPGNAPPCIPIEQRLHEGEQLLVQVAKEPIGSKGARITSYLSLAGRTLVLVPTVDHVGISRRITDEGERLRLRETIGRLRPPGAGFIVRTVAEHQSEDHLRAELAFLLKLWDEVSARAKRVAAPGLVHQDLDLALRVVRDLVSAQVQRVIIDDLPTYTRLLEFVRTFMPEHETRLELYQDREPLFDAHGIEHEIDRALVRKVWLRSGGYLVIDEGEALTAIDVNTGRYVGHRSLEDTITKINLEAVKEVAAQLRLRNIGGIIIVDFIDMELESNRHQVGRALAEALSSDRAKTHALEISPLGLVEMTRQRVRESLMHQLTAPCSHCGGRGAIKTTQTVCYEVLREISRHGANLPGRSLTVSVHPEVADLLADAEQERLSQLERRFGRSLRVEARAGFHPEQFEIRVESE
ncbi:MAG: Rne/Rng family ribonuclease [Proteobacteria bacterium]|nr:Rne/Rng family ribonuclease [Pseudomonadota bacterium]